MNHLKTYRDDEPTGNQKCMKRLSVTLLVSAITICFLSGCTGSGSHGDGLPEGGQYHSTEHSTGWADNPLHGAEFTGNPQNCRACHGEDLNGGSSGISCVDCHHSGWSGTHGQAFAENPSTCKACHGADLKGGPSGVSCAVCHHTGWTGTHGQAFAENPDNCNACHGEDLEGGLSGVSCIPCHHPPENSSFYHGGTVEHIVPEECDTCHGEDLTGGLTSTSCFECHPDRDTCAPCHNLLQSHPVHTITSGKGPSPLACEFCHDENPFNYDQFADGNDLYNTSLCNNCHSPGGSYDGVISSAGSEGAKNNWDVGVYNGNILATGKQAWCAGCHDDVPANSQADGSGIDAPNIVGDDTTYGYYTTGHGKNGVAGCTDCHDAEKNHIDHEYRTYEVDEGPPIVAVMPYSDSYRLKDIDGQPAMNIPRPLYPPDTNPLVHGDDFALCFDCHNRFEVLSENPADVSKTNFWHNDTTPVNSHNSHLGDYSNDFDSDWDGVADSCESCIACHNVHGPPNKAMIRHGELISTPGTTDKVPALNFSYLVTSSSPTATATWTFNVAQDGNYNIFAWWKESPNWATDAPYTIYYDGGSQSIVVNQQMNGSQWNLLGTFPFLASVSGLVQLNNDADSFVIADAIKVEGIGMAVPDIIMDEAQASYLDSWTYVSSDPEAYNGDYRWHAKDFGTPDSNAALAQSVGGDYGLCRDIGF